MRNDLNALADEILSLQNSIQSTRNRPCTDGLDALRPELPWRAIGLTILRTWISDRCSDPIRLPT